MHQATPTRGGLELLRLDPNLIREHARAIIRRPKQCFGGAPPPSLRVCLLPISLCCFCLLIAAPGALRLFFCTWVSHNPFMSSEWEWHGG